MTVRSYLGSEDRSADSLVVAKEGADESPAYRGVAYLVFEQLPLEEYGNRMPVVTAEVFRVVGKLEALVRGVALITGSTEFGYGPAEVTRQIGKAVMRPRTAISSSRSRISRPRSICSKTWRTMRG